MHERKLINVFRDITLPAKKGLKSSLSDFYIKKLVIGVHFGFLTASFLSRFFTF